MSDGLEPVDVKDERTESQISQSSLGESDVGTQSRLKQEIERKSADDILENGSAPGVDVSPSKSDRDVSPSKSDRSFKQKTRSFSVDSESPAIEGDRVRSFLESTSKNELLGDLRVACSSLEQQAGQLGNISKHLASNHQAEMDELRGIAKGLALQADYEAALKDLADEKAAHKQAHAAWQEECQRLHGEIKQFSDAVSLHEQAKYAWEQERRGLYDTINDLSRAVENNTRFRPRRKNKASLLLLSACLIALLAILMFFLAGKEKQRLEPSFRSHGELKNK